MYHDIKGRARAAILANMEREREGDQIDRALLKNTLEIFQEVRPALLEPAACLPGAVHNLLLTAAASEWGSRLPGNTHVTVCITPAATLPLRVNDLGCQPVTQLLPVEAAWGHRWA